jgi:hypothetical protein
MAEELAAELKQFMVQHIESLAQLEVLLYLRDNKDRTIHPREVGGRLALTSDMAPVILADLARRGFIVQNQGTFQYQPAIPETARLIDLLADAYRTRRVTVTTQIYSRPLERVKSFANAFRFRKEQ